MENGMTDETVEAAFIASSEFEGDYGYKGVWRRGCCGLDYRHI